MNLDIINKMRKYKDDDTKLENIRKKNDIQKCIFNDKMKEIKKKKEK